MPPKHIERNNMKLGTKDNILDVVKYLDEQKLQYVLAVWSPPVEQKSDNVTLYSSFKKNQISKLCGVLKDSLIIEDKPELK